MMRQNVLVMVSCLLCCTMLSGMAQTDTTVMLDKDFRFLDGVYMNFEDFRNNTPTYPWEELDAQVVTSPSTFIAQADYIRTKSGDTLDVSGIWGISLNGLPYYRLESGAISTSAAMVFVGLKVRGKLCYYAYETKEERWVEIAAYNPLTGKPFRKGKVSKEIEVVREYLLHFENGEVRAFDKAGLLHFIKDDEQLWKTVDELTDEEVKRKLYKCLLIYDDRNPVYLPLKTKKQ